MLLYLIKPVDILQPVACHTCCECQRPKTLVVYNYIKYLSYPGTARTVGYSNISTNGRNVGLFLKLRTQSANDCTAGLKTCAIMWQTLFMRTLIQTIHWIWPVHRYNLSEFLPLGNTCLFQQLYNTLLNGCGMTQQSAGCLGAGECQKFGNCMIGDRHECDVWYKVPQ